uniref:Ig-like domain-containing protein n=1 Tax=Esox lucius TaxID=8010 RepID=A0A6Q2ZF78_ESOLU
LSNPRVCYFLCCFFTGLTAGDSITPGNNEVISSEGESVNLNCTYETTDTSPWLYWYRHYPNQAPQFILYKGILTFSVFSGFKMMTSVTPTSNIS